MIPKTMRIIAWHGPLPEPGEFMRTKAGSTYLILTRRDNQRPKGQRKSRCFCHLGKLDQQEIEAMPPDAVIHEFHWNGRGR